MTALSDFQRYFQACPLVAIIRGVTPGEVEAIGEALIGAGVRIIEVPLNSPDAFVSIAKLSAHLKGRALIGAGTVLDTQSMARAAAAGAELIVSPNTNVEVISATVGAGLVSTPGYFTPSEAFAALAAGAHALKLFPAEAAPPAVVKAQRAVLPKDVPLIVVGGITPERMADYLDAGANGFGLGGALFRPGSTAEQVSRQAHMFVKALA